MQQFLFRAQDENMTNGDYALFCYQDLAINTTLNPWASYNMHGEDVAYRMQAFRAVKLVREHRCFIYHLGVVFQDHLNTSI